MKTELKLSESHDTYCSCCGRKSLTIWENILKQEIVDNKQIWKGHKRYVNGLGEDNYFYESGELTYCESCGEKLDDENIRWGVGGMPDEMIVVGYGCSCGNKVEF